MNFIICLYCNKILNNKKSYKLFCSEKCRQNFLCKDIKLHPYSIINN